MAICAACDLFQDELIEKCDIIAALDARVALLMAELKRAERLLQRCVDYIPVSDCEGEVDYEATDLCGDIGRALIRCEECEK